MGLLETMGYERVADYPGGLEEWEARGQALEGSEPARIRRAGGRPGASAAWVIGSLEEASPRGLAQLAFGLVTSCAALFWALGFLPGHGLAYQGQPVDPAQDVLSSVYFSLVTATTLGYGDITPLGFSRALAVTEAILGLLLFGAFVSKFLSRRQEGLVAEVARLTYEDHLGRVQSNLHMVIAELQTVEAQCLNQALDPARVRTRLESTVRVFAGELRSIHDLFYRPGVVAETADLEGVLAALTAALDELAAIVSRIEAEQQSEVLTTGLLRVRRLADQICTDCVPQAPPPELRLWMDRVEGLAMKLRDAESA